MFNTIPLSRRQWLATSSGVVAGAALTAPAVLTGQDRPERPISKLKSIEHKGVLVSECTVEGERRSDDVVPAHPNGYQLSRNRWMVVYSTRSFRGVDDDRSIIYQLRAGAPDGRLIKEGAFVVTQTGCDPLGTGQPSFAWQNSHGVIFGVPRGARIRGKPAPQANVFVAKWRRTTTFYDKEHNLIVPFWLPEAKDYPLVRDTPALFRSSLQMQAVEWLQFRLNQKEDDIEIIQPASVLRQKGYESGEAFCSAPVKSMNQSFVQAIPLNRDCTEWVECNHFDGSRLACLRYAFNPKPGRYEWVETGPLLEAAQARMYEAGVARYRDRWVISARPSGRGRGTCWTQTEDLFAGASKWVYREDPPITGPRTAFTCADGVLRLFGGGAALSPYRNTRDPLFCWEIDPDNDFNSTNSRVVFDSVKAGIPMRAAARPMIDNCKLLPSRGRTQWLAFRVLTSAINLLRSSGGNGPDYPVANAQEKASCGVHYCQVVYSEDFPPLWEF